MKRVNSLLSFLLILALIYYSFSSLMPKEAAPASIDKTLFSAERALVPLKEITKAPHYLGTEEHTRVRNYLVEELRKLGLQPEVQEGFVLNTKWKSLDKSKNILAKITGSQSGKSLLIFSHYDSAPVPSFGASDAGSGVVTILESLRAYLASGEQPKNDIIILFTDAEELGLDGARLFVNQHPWAKNVGLALNFEARGSGGPGNMIVETNGGNKNLINAFIEANPDYPVASSLMYSIYKKLPNDTDSTVFREDGNIDGFFFAFIDDHFDYHTANDNFENLDRNTLQHQGENLLPLLHYFANADLSQLSSNEDYVYINFPVIKMISYPFSWVKPMFFIALLLFVVLLFLGIKKNKLKAKEIGKGFGIFTSSLLINGLIGFFGWKLLLLIYPHYQEIQHGFTYNGHTYISFFVVLTIALSFFLYKKYGKNNSTTNLFVAPLFFWLLINAYLAFVLQGGAFFIIPFYFALLAFWVLIRQESTTAKPNTYLMILLAVPALFMFPPLIKFLPVGLGLKMLVASAVLTVLLFGLLLPVLGFYQSKKAYGYFFLLVSVLLFIKAHTNSKFTAKHQKPNSLVYFNDADKKEAYWATYDRILDPWTKGYLGDQPEEASNYISLTSGSKYKRGYSFATKAPKKNIPLFTCIKNQDTTIENLRKVTFTIIPKRKVNLISLYSENDFSSISYNGIPMPKDTTHASMKFKTPELVRYFVTDGDSLEVSYHIKPTTPVTFTVVEYSFDLLNNELFTISKRPENMMPKPFIITDAVIVKKTFEPQLLTLEKRDSVTINEESRLLNNTKPTL